MALSKRSKPHKTWAKVRKKKTRGWQGEGNTGSHPIADPTTSDTTHQSTHSGITRSRPLDCPDHERECCHEATLAVLRGGCCVLLRGSRLGRDAHRSGSAADPRTRRYHRGQTGLLRRRHQPRTERLAGDGRNGSWVDLGAR